MKQQLIEIINNYSNLIGLTLEALESIPDMEEISFHMSTSRPGKLALDLPYDIGMFKRFRRSLGKSWQMDSVRVDPSGYAAYDYFHRDMEVELTVYLEPRQEGATCKRVKTGTVTKEIDVYEIVCS